MSDFENLSGLSDEELDRRMSKELERSYMPANAARANAYLLERSRRSQEATRIAVVDLKTAIDRFNAASERFSRRIVLLTCALVFLTVLLIPGVTDGIRRIIWLVYHVAVRHGG